MVDRMQRHGVMVTKKDDALMAEAEERGGGGGGASPASPASGGGGEADRQAQVAANRARMQALAGKK
jgi:hypothetical protein